MNAGWDEKRKEEGECVELVCRNYFSALRALDLLNRRSRSLWLNKVSCGRTRKSLAALPMHLLAWLEGMGFNDVKPTSVPACAAS